MNLQPVSSAKRSSGVRPKKGLIRKGMLSHKRGWLLAAMGLGLIVFWNCLPSALFDTPYSTVLVDREGRLLGASIANDEQWRFPPVDAVPHKFAQAVVCYEDRRFYTHPGVDPLAVGRALWQNLRADRVISGASTISMQVIRLSRPERPRSVFEKLIEMVMALRLELSLSKAEILALYASYAPFGGNVVGIDAASWRYFGREPQRLSWAEACMLAVLPNTPALIHPGRNRRLLLQRRNDLLARLHKDGVIDDLTCKLAQKEPLPPKPHPIPQLAPHLLDRIKQDMAARSHSDTRQPGRIRTTLKKELQARASEIVRRHRQQLSGNGIHNAAVLILEVNSGHILAYVGNAFKPSGKEHGTHVDIITAPRSTGSILKPLLYAAMLESGDLLPDQLVPDIPTRIGGFAPQNYSRAYHGAVPASRALARSLNVPAVRMLQSYGVDRFYALLKALGMRTLHRSASDYGLSLILGGAEGTLWDITGIYAGLARGLNRTGRQHPDHQQVFSPPRYLLTPQQSDPTDRNEVLFASSPNSMETPLGPGTCWLALQAMLEVERPGSDGAWRSFASSSRIAWKTGTSYGHRDAWAVGVTPRYAVGVWAGNADGEGRPGLTGIAAAAPILFEIFDLLDTGEWFTTPEADLREITICAKSGHRAGPHCAATCRAWVSPAALGSKACPYCRIVHLDPSRTWRVHSKCQSVSAIEPDYRFVLPPAMEWYYRKKHSDYRRLPPFRDDCTAALGLSQAMSLIYPGNKGVIYVPIELDGQLGRTVFEAAHRDASAVIYWHLDDRYLGSTRDLHQMALAPEPGEHIIILVDETGQQVQRRFTVLAK